MANHLLVGNPTAQSGKNRERIDEALLLMKGAGIAADLLPTLPGGKTIGAVRDALDAGTYRVVIAMGGDGTFREVDPVTAGRAVLSATCWFHHPAHAAEWGDPTIGAAYDDVWRLLMDGLGVSCREG